MQKFSDQSTRTKYKILFGAFVTLWILVALGCVVFVQLGLGPWIELFNGATWPNALSFPIDTPKPLEQYGVWFFAVLSLRTVLNLGVVLSAVFAVSWVIGGGLERLIMKKAEVISNMRDVFLVGELVTVLKQNGITPAKEVEDKLYQAAREFDSTALGRTLQKEVEDEVHG